MSKGKGKGKGRSETAILMEGLAGKLKPANPRDYEASFAQALVEADGEVKEEMEGFSLLRGAVGFKEEG